MDMYECVRRLLRMNECVNEQMMWSGYVYITIVRGRQGFMMVGTAFIRGCNGTNGKQCGAWKSVSERGCKIRGNGITRLLVVVSRGAREQWVK
jgi:hypothetical protein